MPLCTDRARRPNAGSKMPKLLNDEEEDEFYTSVYGGFTEEADDLDYESESSVDDSVDTDFDNETADEEGDDAGSDDDEAQSKKRRRSGRVVTKGYQEPKRSKPCDEKDSTKNIPAKHSSAPSSKSVGKSESQSDALQTTPALEPHTLRQSTIRATAKSEAVRRLGPSDTSVMRKAMLAEMAQRKNVPEVRRLTQEELLAEAKLTEEINRRSLERYQRLEVEKKKARFQKTVSSTPMTRYHSFTVPLMDEQPELYGVAVDRVASTIRAGPIIGNPSARCSRNLITFADANCLRAAMPRTATILSQSGKPPAAAPRPRSKLRVCPISGLPARYMDPVTLTPYANLAAFRVLRRLYAIHLETNTPPIDLLREYRNG